jgi:hypothetical protein
MAEGQGEIGPALTRLAEVRGGPDASMQEHVRSLDLSLKRLLDEVATGREHLVGELRDELRLMSRALAASSTGSGTQGRKQASAS